MFAAFSPTVIIVRSELVGAFQRHFGDEPTVIIMDGGATPHWMTGLEHSVGVIAVDPQLLGTAEGRASLSHLRDCADLPRAEFRVLTADCAGVPILLRSCVANGARTVITAASQLLPRGLMRRVPRLPMADGTEALVNGLSASVIDLSVLGAQVLARGVLRPNQRVSMRILPDDPVGGVRVRAAIAWSMFELPRPSAPRYRAGLEFTTADIARLETFCTEHRRSRDAA